jgi:hypothetical protein
MGTIWYLRFYWHKPAYNFKNLSVLFEIHFRFCAILDIIIIELRKLFGFPIFRFWAYVTKVIAETRRVH